MADVATLPLRDPTSADVDSAVRFAMEVACPVGLRRELAQLLAAPGLDIEDFPDPVVEEAADRAIAALWDCLETSLAARRAELGPVRKLKSSRRRK